MYKNVTIFPFISSFSPTTSLSAPSTVAHTLASHSACESWGVEYMPALWDKQQT